MQATQNFTFCDLQYKVMQSSFRVVRDFTIPNQNKKKLAFFCLQNPYQTKYPLLKAKLVIA
jgi:hypothetical protein